MPPEPRPLAEAASRSSSASSARSCTSRTSSAPVRARVAREQPLGVGQQHEQARTQQQRDLRRERVVVAERDLVRGGGVVLVDDRDDVPGQQRLERRARVQVARAPPHVVRRQEHLRRAAAGRGERPLPGAGEQALSDRRGGLQARHVARPHLAIERAQAQRDRPARDDAHGRAGQLQGHELGGQAREARPAEAPATVDERRRPQLDDDGAAHAAPA